MKRILITILFFASFVCLQAQTYTLSGHITDAVTVLFDRIVNKDLLVRRLNITTNHVIPESRVKKQDDKMVQLDLFTDYDALDKERRIQDAMLSIRKKFGNNAVVKGMDLLDGATTIERNDQIGGHRK